MRGYAMWTRCRSKDLNDYQLSLPDPGELTDPTVDHPQMNRLAFERGPEWLGDDEPRHWGAALVWWQPTKEYLAQVYVDGRFARSESFEKRSDADTWFNREVADLRHEDARLGPPKTDLAAMPPDRDDAENPQVAD